MSRPVAVLFAAISILGLASSDLFAATIAVTTTADELNADGDCSLREAVRAANTNLAVDACAAGQNDQTDTISVPAGTYTLTVAGNDNDAAGGDLDLRDNTAVDDLVLTGAGAATTIVQACAVEQQSADCPMGQGVVDRVFHVIDAHVAIDGLTVRHGRAIPVNSTRHGQGIYVQKISGAVGVQPALALTDVVVTKNGVTSDSGIMTRGGGILADDTTLTLTRVTVSENVASGGEGGGIHSRRNTNGVPVLTMADSTVSGNSSGGHGGGILAAFDTTATLTNSTISGNEAGGSGGGIANLSGATMTLTNCTVSGNRAHDSFGGGIFHVSTAPLAIRSSTVTLNVLGTGQGAGGITAAGGGSVVLRNSIVAGNIHQTNPSSPSYSPDCDEFGGTVDSEGYNLVGDGSDCPLLLDGEDGNQIGTSAAVLDSELGPLADNGGPTLTHALLDGSLAIDGGNPAAPGSGGTACPATDQRGESRPSGGACDVGSFEGGGGGAIAATAVKPASGGTAGTVQVRVLGNGFAPGAVVRLVRAGFADVVGTVASVRPTLITTSLDLRNAAPGVWSVEVENPDATVATLPGAFTVEAGGGAELSVEVITPMQFHSGRVQSIYVLVDNRGTVDAYGVPLWLAFSEALQFFVPFVVSPPPAQPGQIATDWTRVAIDVGRPASPEIPEKTDTFHFLLPIVPAGSSSALRFRVKSPFFLEPTDPGVPVSLHVATDVGEPYFQPELSETVVGFYVSQAKQYATAAHGTTSFPADAAIAAYVRTQLAAVIAEGRESAVANATGNLPVYSQAQLIIDTGQFIAGESATAAATSGARGWLAHIVAELIGRSAEARVADPCASYTDVNAKIFCEEETDPCRDGCPDDPLPPFPPTVPCEGSIKIVLDVLGVPCKPAPRIVPFSLPHDPNYKAGPGGPGGFIDGVTPLTYSVTFENVATATGDAFEVLVTDQLDTSKYDLDTFSLGPILLADRLVPVPPDLKQFSTEVDMRPGVNILVGIDAELDMATGIVTWKFTTLDPATHEFPEDPVDGFLPPNVTSPEGEGEMLFTVSLKPGFGLGTTVCNDASIVFDFNPPIATPEFCNTIGDPEDCENCVDDDGDQLVDRGDADCAPPADGAGAGLGDPAAGKLLDKCGKTVRKAAEKLGADRLKRLGACEKAVADCVHLKPGDQACLAKAGATCAKTRAAFAGADGKLHAAVTKACGDPPIAIANVLAAAGAGFAGEVEACARRGVADLATIADVAACLGRQRSCAAERLFAAAVPRARELLVLGGLDPLTDLGCVDGIANGGGTGVAEAKRKPLRKCDLAIQKATTKLVAGRAKAAEACAAPVFACVQTKPDDDACVDKARGKCAKAVAALPQVSEAFAAAVAKACGAAPLTPDDLLASTGLGVAALDDTCAALGVANVATVAEMSACLERQATCRTDQWLESATPRLDELLDLGGVTLP